MRVELSAFFDRVRPVIDASLDRLLPAESAAPEQIHQAMRYSIFAGGKRLRPALCVAGYEIMQPEWQQIVPVACAFEMIHTYSLIHDDLPAMDNDDFRRGIPSCHKKFGEAMAILAGDALLTIAFETMANCKGFPPNRLLHAIALMGRASGTQSGMIAGQVFDIEAERRPIDETDVQRIHSAKTGALITTAVVAGAYLGGCDDRELAVVRTFGARIGLAFQIVDDILDETASTEALGKTGGKDRSQQKATYPARYGLEESRRLATRVTSEAREVVAPLGDRARVLISIAEYLENRSN
jgi:geranylgeranyl diphosphate synthase type II